MFLKMHSLENILLFQQRQCLSMLKRENTHKNHKALQVVKLQCTFVLALWQARLVMGDIDWSPGICF